MNITVNFESLEEFQKYMGQQPAAMIVMSGEAAKAMAASAEDNAKKIKKAAQEAQEAPAEAEPVKSTPKAEKPAQEAQDEPQQAPVPAAPAVDRVTVRKALAALNKKTKENTAAKLIHEMGFDVLTSVPEDRLAELLQKAENYAE